MFNNIINKMGFNLFSDNKEMLDNFYYLINYGFHRISKNYKINYIDSNTINYYDLSDNSVFSLVIHDSYLTIGNNVKNILISYDNINNILIYNYSYHNIKEKIIINEYVIYEYIINGYKKSTTFNSIKKLTLS